MNSWKNSEPRASGHRRGFRLGVLFLDPVVVVVVFFPAGRLPDRVDFAQETHFGGGGVGGLRH